MALSEEERKRVTNMLDELDRNQLDKVLASLDAFGKWLSNTAYSIYSKVKDALNSLWRSISDIFS
jgi:DNA-directed RNA polymerase